jgi:hypothetical protein
MMMGVEIKRGPFSTREMEGHMSLLFVSIFRLSDLGLVVMLKMMC